MTLKIQYLGVDARGQRRPHGGDRLATGPAAVTSTNPVPAAPASGAVIARLLSDAPARVAFGSPPDLSSAGAVVVRPGAPVDVVVTSGHRPAAALAVETADRPPSLTVAQLGALSPQPPAGTQAWASDGRALTGSGSAVEASPGGGVAVTRRASGWCIAGTSITVQA